MLLCRLQDNPTLGGILAGAHGLEFTQPFHDKRVVELALAIPQELYSGDGKQRYLARTALADLYPAEFQTRLPGNIDRMPDFMGMAKQIEPQILAEIDRLEKSPTLSRYFDFPRMRRMLIQRPRDQRDPEFRVRQVARAFLYARYMEWFTRDNR
jgi:asparagine synthase (glutamine-hydrolysing)